MKKLIIIILITFIFFLSSCKYEPKTNLEGIKERLTCVEQKGKICQDYQVCDGSVLTSTDSNMCCFGECKLPKSFDWRNRHGENWLTSVKNQGNLGSCYSFATIGEIETQINLYYNQHLNVDLSEQFLEDCQSCCAPGDIKSISGFFLPDDCKDDGCGSISQHFCRFKEHGIIIESCDPYTELYRGQCTYENICRDWQEKNWRISDYEIYAVNNFGEIGENDKDCDYIKLTNEEELKELLIKKGPMATGLNYRSHAMVLAGYETDEKEQITWIFKNSWGVDNADGGYMKVTDKIKPGRETYIIDEIMPLFVPIGPFIPPTGKNYEILCVDKDDDNFCNWGIMGSMPLTCPSSCEPEKDWDDSNPNIGALGLY